MYQNAIMAPSAMREIIVYLRKSLYALITSSYRFPFEENFGKRPKHTPMRHR